MNAPQLTDILKFEFEHIKLNDWQLECTHCKDVSNALTKPMSLRNHIYTYSGFVNMHKDCKPDGKSIWSNET